MPGDQLRRVVERAAEVQTAIRKIEFGRDQKQGMRRKAVGELEEARSQLRAMEHQLSVARSESEQFDRPLVRRLHRSEVESARSQLRWLPAAVENERVKVADLERQVESLSQHSPVERLDEGRKTNLKADLVDLRSQLSDDAHVRGRGLAENVSDGVRSRLGPVPIGAATREVWIEAAGRLAQHQMTWDVAEEHLLGRRPQMFQGEAYEITWHAAAKAMSALDRSMGRNLSIEPPSRGLSR